MQNEPDHVPEALYGCEGCERRFCDTADLYWCGGDWLCGICQAFSHEPLGITLADYLKRRDTPADYDGLPVEMVTTHDDADNLTFPDWTPADVTGSWACPNGCTKGNSVLITGNHAYIKCYDCGLDNDPINAAYREAIKAEDVPEWAELKKGGAK